MGIVPVQESWEKDENAVVVSGYKWFARFKKTRGGRGWVLGV